MTRRPWTKAEVRRLAEMLRSGTPRAAVAEALQRTSKALERGIAIARSMGLDVASPPPSPSPKAPRPPLPPPPKPVVDPGAARGFNRLCGDEHRYGCFRRTARHGAGRPPIQKHVAENEHPAHANAPFSVR